jgi:hypothetical protein
VDGGPLFFLSFVQVLNKEEEEEGMANRYFPLVTLLLCYPPKRVWLRDVKSFAWSKLAPISEWSA